MPGNGRERKGHVRMGANKDWAALIHYVTVIVTFHNISVCL